MPVIRTPAQMTSALDEAIERQRTGLTIKPVTVLRILSPKTPIQLTPAERDQIADHLEILDPMWGVRLQVVAGRRPERSASTATLWRRLVERASAEVAVPAELRPVAGTADALVAWGQRWLAAGDPATPHRPEALIVALHDWWGDDAFGDVLLGLVNGWPPLDRQARERDRPDRFLSSIFDPPGTTATAAGLRWAVSRTLERQAGLQERMAEALQEADRLRAVRDRLMAERDELSGSLAGAERDLATALSEANRLRADLEAERAARAIEVREVTAKAGEGRAGLQSRIAGELGHQMEEIEIFLDRPNPNVAGALRRVHEVRDLISRLIEGRV